MKNLKVVITQDHIDRGRACSKDSCPLGLALRDMGYRNIEVKGGVNRGEGITIDGVWLPHTPNSQHFVALVDDPYHGAHPVTLNIPVPDNFILPHERKRR